MFLVGGYAGVILYMLMSELCLAICVFVVLTFSSYLMITKSIKIYYQETSVKVEGNDPLLKAELEKEIP